MNRQLRCFAALLARLAPSQRLLRLSRAIHATWLNIPLALATLEPSNLIALGGNCSPQRGHLLQQPQHQIFQVGVPKAVNIGRRRHSQNESDSRPLGNRIIIPPRLLPLLPTFQIVFLKTTSASSSPPTPATQSVSVGGTGLAWATVSIPRAV